MSTINAMKVENIVTLDRFYKEIIGHLVKICVFILKTESVEKSTYRLPLLVLLCRKFDMSPFPFPNLKIIFIIFFPFRLTSARNLTAQQINRALEDIPFDSDKCGLSDNNDMYTRTGCRPGRKHNDDIPATMMMWELFWKLEEVLWPKTFLIWRAQRFPPCRQDLYSLCSKGGTLQPRPRCGSGKRGVCHQSTCLQAL